MFQHINNNILVWNSDILLTYCSSLTGLNTSWYLIRKTNYSTFFFSYQLVPTYLRLHLCIVLMVPQGSWLCNELLVTNTQIIIGLTTLRIEIKAQTLVWTIFLAIIPNKKLIYIHNSLLHLFSFIFQTEINNNEITYSVRNSSNFLLTAWCWVYLFGSGH